MMAGLRFKQVRHDKDMMLSAGFSKMVRDGKYDLEHKRSRQAFRRMMKRLGR